MFLYILLLLFAGGTIARVITLGDRSRKGYTVLLYESLFPYVGYYAVMLAFAFFMPFGVPAFWLLIVPVFICALVAQFRMRREGRRYLRLRGLLEPPEGQQIVPKDQVLIFRWLAADWPKPDGSFDRSPALAIFRAGDLFHPERFDHERTVKRPEYIWLAPGEERILTGKLAIIGTVNKWRIRNQKGNPKVKIAERTS